MMLADERYLKDPVFAQLVEMIYIACVRGQFTPTEVREAATMAQIKYEMQNPRPIVISEKLRRELNL